MMPLPPHVLSLSSSSPSLPPTNIGAIPPCSPSSNVYSPPPPAAISPSESRARNQLIELNVLLPDGYFVSLLVNESATIHDVKKAIWRKIIALQRSLDSPEAMLERRRVIERAASISAARLAASASSPVNSTRIGSSNINENFVEKISEEKTAKIDDETIRKTAMPKQSKSPVNISQSNNQIAFNDIDTVKDMKQEEEEEGEQDDEEYIISTQHIDETGEQKTNRSVEQEKEKGENVQIEMKKISEDEQFYLEDEEKNDTEQNENAVQSEAPPPPSHQDELTQFLGNDIDTYPHSLSSSTTTTTTDKKPKFLRNFSFRHSIRRLLRSPMSSEKIENDDIEQPINGDQVDRAEIVRERNFVILNTLDSAEQQRQRHHHRKLSKRLSSFLERIGRFGSIRRTHQRSVSLSEIVFRASPESSMLQLSATLATPKITTPKAGNSIVLHSPQVDDMDHIDYDYQRSHSTHTHHLDTTNHLYNHNHNNQFYASIQHHQHFEHDWKSSNHSYQPPHHHHHHHHHHLHHHNHNQQQRQHYQKYSSPTVESFWRLNQAFSSSSICAELMTESVSSISSLSSIAPNTPPQSSRSSSFDDLSHRSASQSTATAVLANFIQTNEYLRAAAESGSTCGTSSLAAFASATGATSFTTNTTTSTATMVTARHRYEPNRSIEELHDFITNFDYRYELGSTLSEYDIECAAIALADIAQFDHIAIMNRMTPTDGRHHPASINKSNNNSNNSNIDLYADTAAFNFANGSLDQYRALNAIARRHVAEYQLMGVTDAFGAAEEVLLDDESMPLRECAISTADMYFVKLIESPKCAHEKAIHNIVSTIIGRSLYDLDEIESGAFQQFRIDMHAIMRETVERRQRLPIDDRIFYEFPCALDDIDSLTLSSKRLRSQLAKMQIEFKQTEPGERSTPNRDQTLEADIGTSKFKLRNLAEEIEITKQNRPQEYTQILAAIAAVNSTQYSANTSKKRKKEKDPAQMISERALRLISEVLEANDSEDEVDDVDELVAIDSAGAANAGAKFKPSYRFIHQQEKAASNAALLAKMEAAAAAEGQKSKKRSDASSDQHDHYEMTFDRVARPSASTPVPPGKRRIDVHVWISLHTYLYGAFDAPNPVPDVLHDFADILDSITPISDEDRERFLSSPSSTLNDHQHSSPTFVQGHQHANHRQSPSLDSTFSADHRNAANTSPLHSLSPPPSTAISSKQEKEKLKKDLKTSNHSKSDNNAADSNNNIDKKSDRNGKYHRQSKSSASSWKKMFGNFRKTFSSSSSSSSSTAISHSSSFALSSSMTCQQPPPPPSASTSALSSLSSSSSSSSSTLINDKQKFSLESKLASPDYQCIEGSNSDFKPTRPLSPLSPSIETVASPETVVPITPTLTTNAASKSPQSILAENPHLFPRQYTLRIRPIANEPRDVIAKTLDIYCKWLRDRTNSMLREHLAAHRDTLRVIDGVARPITAKLGSSNDYRAAKIKTSNIPLKNANNRINDCEEPNGTEETDNGDDDVCDEKEEVEKYLFRNCHETAANEPEVFANKLLQFIAALNRAVSERTRFDAGKYLLKICGFEQYLIGNRTLNVFEYIRLCMSKNKPPQLMLLPKRSIVARLPAYRYVEPTFFRRFAFHRNPDILLPPGSAVLVPDSRDSKYNPGAKLLILCGLTHSQLRGRRMSGKNSIMQFVKKLTELKEDDEDGDDRDDDDDDDEAERDEEVKEENRAAIEKEKKAEKRRIEEKVKEKSDETSSPSSSSGRQRYHRQRGCSISIRPSNGANCISASSSSSSTIDQQQQKSKQSKSIIPSASPSNNPDLIIGKSNASKSNNKDIEDNKMKKAENFNKKSTMANSIEDVQESMVDSEESNKNNNPIITATCTATTTATITTTTTKTTGGAPRRISELMAKPKNDNFEYFDGTNSGTQSRGATIVCRYMNDAALYGWIERGIAERRLISLWRLRERSFRCRIILATYLRVKDIDKVFVTAAVYHGDELLCLPRTTSFVDPHNPRWEEIIEFSDLRMIDIPLGAKLSLSIGGIVERRDRPAAVSLATGTGIGTGPIGNASGAGAGTGGGGGGGGTAATDNASEPFASHWANVPLFDYKRCLVEGRCLVQMWPMPKSFDGFLNPLGVSGPVDAAASPTTTAASATNNDGHVNSTTTGGISSPSIPSSIPTSISSASSAFYGSSGAANIGMSNSAMIDQSTMMMMDSIIGSGNPATSGATTTTTAATTISTPKCQGINALTNLNIEFDRFDRSAAIVFPPKIAIREYAAVADNQDLMIREKLCAQDAETDGDTMNEQQQQQQQSQQQSQSQQQPESVNRFLRESTEYWIARQLRRLTARRDPFGEMIGAEKNFFWRERETILRSCPDALPKVLEAVQWNRREEISQMYRLLERWPTISADTAIVLLGARYADPLVQRFSVRCLDRTLTDGLMAHYLVQFMQLLRNDPYHDSPLARLLLRRALSNRHFGHLFFWTLRSQLHDRTCADRWSVLIEQYCRGLSRDALAAVARQVEALDEIERISNDTIGEGDRRGIILRLIERADILPKISRFYNPLDIGVPLDRLIPHRLRVMDSAKRPLWLEWNNPDPFARLTQSDVSAVIFKSGDDLRQDMLTLQVIRIMDLIWRRKNLDLKMLPYNCIATGDQVGMIEVVKRAKTVMNIQRDGGRMAALQVDSSKLFKWLKDCNPTNVDTVVDTFTRSCAGYCVATFILGVGDRNPDNIMVNEDGQIFHIDFGHFLGHFKKKFGIQRERVPFVLTYDFLQVITKGADDPLKSREFENFQRLCYEAYLALHENANLLISLFMMMIGTGIPELQTYDDVQYLRRTLAVEKSREEALQYFETQLDEAHGGAWSTKLDWFFHSVKHA